MEWSVASEEKYTNGYRLVIKHNKASILSRWFSVVSKVVFVIARFAFCLADEFVCTHFFRFRHRPHAFVPNSDWLRKLLKSKFTICTLPISEPRLPPKILHSHRFRFLLGRL